MTPENFVYWLQGFFEISGTKNITAEQAKVIKDHLDLVFEKKTPDRKVLAESEEADDDEEDLLEKIAKQSTSRQMYPSRAPSSFLRSRTYC